MLRQCVKEAAILQSPARWVEIETESNGNETRRLGGIMSYRVSQMRRFVAALLVVSSVLMHSAVAFAYETEADLPRKSTPPFVDLVVTRPFGIAATGVGLALFVPTAILTAIVAPRDMNVPFEVLVWAPIKYTFVDRLGEH